jgi:hypothetical protein
MNPAWKEPICTKGGSLQKSPGEEVQAVFVFMFWGSD